MVESFKMAFDGKIAKFSTSRGITYLVQMYKRLLIFLSKNNTYNGKVSKIYTYTVKERKTEREGEDIELSLNYS